MMRDHGTPASALQPGDPPDGQLAWSESGLVRYFGLGRDPCTGHPPWSWRAGLPWCPAAPARGPSD